MNTAQAKLYFQAEKKHSVRYDTKDENAAMQTAYISKMVMKEPYPRAITINVEWE